MEGVLPFPPSSHLPRDKDQEHDLGLGNSIDEACDELE